MLTILIGRAKTGKSDQVLRRMAELGNIAARSCWCRNTPPIRRKWMSAAPAATRPAAMQRY